MTLLLYYKVVFLYFCLECKHNNGMTLSPLFQEMAEEFAKMKCKTISFEIKVLITLFTFQVSKTQYSGQNTIQHNENMTYQKK